MTRGTTNGHVTLARMSFLSRNRRVPSRPLTTIYILTSHAHLQMTSRTRLKRKEVDDVLGGEEMWKDADQTDSEFLCLNRRRWTEDNDSIPEQCDKCESNRAYFRQLQIRSADEPMTTCESWMCTPNVPRSIILINLKLLCAVYL